ncbi:MAG: caspase family protein [Archangium sp.]|nr:caspase family protein [Archangium sp.]
MRGVALCCCLLALPAFAQEAGPLHRFAIFIGQNEGGEGTKPLLYARDDAKRLHDVFLRLGGVKPEDAMLILDETADDVTTALGELERRIRDAKSRGERTTLLFYYSGHAKDGSLRLGTTKLPLESVKSRLATGPADMRVAFLDACRSGAVTRTKGVRRAPAFEVETDATRQAKGLVILTSSASDEDSQESDLIGASYFSYHLATGLLGSADTGDGRVTLSEAYAWAYERTVASTADSAAGPQHPTFSFDLAGNGDLVLTDVAERHEGLRIPASAPTGPYFIIDPRGVVVAEAVKLENERLIALAPGHYTIKRRLPDRLRIGSVDIEAGQVATIDETTFQNAKFSDDPVKGTGISSIFSRHWSLSASGHYQAVFDRPTNAGGYFPSAPLIGAEATLHNFFGRGFALSVDGGYGWTTGVVSGPLLGNLAYKYDLITIGAALFYEWFQGDRWIPFAGIHLSFNIMSREFTDTALAKQSYSTFTPGIVAGLKIRLTKSVSVVARARVHYLLYNVDETRSLGSADFGALLDYEFKD